MHQLDSHPFTHTLSSTTTAPPKQEPVDLAAIRQQIRENMEKLDQLFLPSMLTMMTAPPTRQPDATLPPPTLFPTTEPELLATLQPATQYTDEKLPDLQCSLLPKLASPSTLMRSRIEHIISQINSSNALWMPNAVHQRPYSYANQSNGLDTTVRPSELDNCTHFSALITQHPDNPHPAKPATRFFNPAFDIHLTWLDPTQCYQHSAFDIYRTLTAHRQQRHQHHPISPNYATRPYNPAYDIHLTRTVPHQTTQQNQTHFSVATYVPGLAQNKRPP